MKKLRNIPICVIVSHMLVKFELKIPDLLSTHKRLKNLQKKN